MTAQKPIPFTELLKKGNDPVSAQEVESTLLEGDTLMRLAQTFRALLQQRPKFAISYEAAKEHVVWELTAHRDGHSFMQHDQRAPAYYHDRIFADPRLRNFLPAFVMALRAPAAMIWVPTWTAFGQVERPAYIGFREKGVQTIQYTQADGYEQPIKIAHYLEMGIMNGRDFKPMSAIKSKFEISEKGARALLGLDHEQTVPPKTSTGPVSPVGDLIKNNYEAPNNERETRRRVQAAYLPGFFRPKSP